MLFAMLVVGYAAVSAAHEPAAATGRCDLVRDRDGRPAGVVTERGQADCATAREVRGGYFYSSAPGDGSACLRKS